MRVLLVTDAYPPEIRSASHLMIELAEELTKRGHEVTVLTSYPAYNLDESAQIQVFRECEIESSIKVIRVKTLPIHKVNFIVRGIAQVSLPWFFEKSLKRNAPDSFEVVIVYSPPLPLAKIGSHLKHKYGIRFILNVQDIFPQNAIDLGVLKNLLLIYWFELIERKAYKNADIVTVHSTGNRRFLLDRGYFSDPQKLHILHNWIDVEAISHGSSSINYRKKLNLEDKFIFLFAGVMGPSQGLNRVIDVAQRLNDLKDVVFLFVGDGMEKAILEKKAQTLGLGNVLFHPFVSKEAYTALVNSVDIGIVSLTAKNKTPVVPGKILGYMAAAKPVLAFINAESDGHSIIQEAMCGFSLVSDRPIDELAEAARSLYSKRDSLEEMGLNGQRYAKKMFDKSVCIDEIEKLFHD